MLASRSKFNEGVSNAQNVFVTVGIVPNELYDIACIRPAAGIPAHALLEWPSPHLLAAVLSNSLSIWRSSLLRIVVGFIPTY